MLPTKIYETNSPRSASLTIIILLEYSTIQQQHKPFSATSSARQGVPQRCCDVVAANLLVDRLLDLVRALVAFVETTKERVPVTQVTEEIAEVVGVREVFDNRTEEQIVGVPVRLNKEDIVEVTQRVPFERIQTRVWEPIVAIKEQIVAILAPQIKEDGVDVVRVTPASLSGAAVVPAQTLQTSIGLFLICCVM